MCLSSGEVNIYTTLKIYKCLIISVFIFVSCAISLAVNIVAIFAETFRRFYCGFVSILILKLVFFVSCLTLFIISALISFLETN